MSSLTSEKPILSISLGRGGAKRRFERGSITALEKSLENLRSEDNIDTISIAIQEAFADVSETSGTVIRRLIKEVLENIEQLYYHDQPMSWWLNEFTSVVDVDQRRSSSHTKYKVTVKACKGYLFYVLQGLRRDMSGQTDEHCGQQQWELLSKPFFRAAPPTRRPEDRRGMADTLLLLAPKLETYLSKPQGLAEFLSWFNIEFEWTVSKLSRRHRLVLEMKPEWSQLYVSSVYGKCIVLPPRNKSILVSSPNVRKAISDLSEVWHNPTAKSVVLSAWTGSGKEILTELLVDAMGSDLGSRVNLSAPALQTAQRLGEEIGSRLEKERDKKEKTVIFLDEVHRVEDVRSGLLRLMETGQVGQNRYNEPFQLESPLYILAASLPAERLRSLEPRDLWTRIEYTIELKHPLRIREKDNRETENTRDKAKKCLMDYFEFFWFEQVDKWRETSDLLPSVEIALDALKDNKFVEDLATEFAKELQGPFKPMVSIRTIRSMVKRLFGRAVNESRILVGHASQEVREKIKDSFGVWTMAIFDELVPEIDPRGLF